jgi:hypothetical protein
MAGTSGGGTMGVKVGADVAVMGAIHGGAWATEQAVAALRRSKLINLNDLMKKSDTEMPRMDTLSA